uniref:Protein kinase domain-containing protein n=1 Tax=Chlamydomonas leiostraca TaxID=1034604 RepID=A0A7S0S379_9CHLO|mmetsp:Transcript_4220/g.10545  ORF Transcript_4220/g.10545 Transcript_4220/m.10545 type:complete len:727 (+) Transcript_4220:76-2256(+)
MKALHRTTRCAGVARRAAVCLASPRSEPRCRAAPLAAPALAPAVIKDQVGAAQPYAPDLQEDQQQGVSPRALQDAQMFASPDCTDPVPSGHWLGWPRDIWELYSLDEDMKLLGAGAFGKVLLGKRRQDSHAVAIKMIRKARQDIPWPDHANHLKHEVHVWTMCQNSQSVVRFEGCYEDEEHAYLVQELCTGGDLRAVLKRGPLTEQEAAQVMHAVLDTIHECHTHHYSYGDCKPANFLLKHPHATNGWQPFPEPSLPSASTLDAAGHMAGSPEPPFNLEECAVPERMMPDEAGGAMRQCSPGAQVIADSRTVSPAHDQHRPQQAPAASMASDGASSTRAADSIGTTSSSDGDHILRISAAVVEANAGVSSKWDMRVPLADGRRASPPFSGKARRKAAAAVAAELAVEVAAAGADAAAEISTAHAAAVANNVVPLVASAASDTESAPEPARPMHAGAAVIAAASFSPNINLTSSFTGSSDEQPSASPSQHHAAAPAPLKVLACDFGCSQPLSSRARVSAVHAKRMGSPVYMAPELWQGGGAMGLAIDMWACGVMLYQLLSGRYPFWTQTPDQIDNSMELYQVVCGVSSNPILMHGEPWSHVSKPCKQLILAMLERNPGERITALEALQSPWLRQQLGFSPTPTSCVNPYASLGSMDAPAESGLLIPRDPLHTLPADSVSSIDHHDHHHLLGPAEASYVSYDGQERGQSAQEEGGGSSGQDEYCNMQV